MKSFLLSLFLLFSTISFGADITHPFYLPPMQKLLSSTQFSYQKFHVKNLPTGYSNYRTRDIFLSQQFSYGIAPKVAIEFQLSNAWDRLKYDTSFSSDGEDTNIAWQMGAVYNMYQQNSFTTHAKILYRQKETHHLNGAYKAFYAQLKSGYDFNWFLPYISAHIEAPVFQGKNADNNFKYNAAVGLYKKAGPIALDIALHYDYDKLWKSKNCYVNTALYSYFLSNTALGFFFIYSIEDNGKNNAHADSHSIGITLKKEF